MSYRQTGYIDDRRVSHGFYESYKPRQGSYDRNHDSRDRSRDRDRPSLQRDGYHRDVDLRDSGSRSYECRDSRDGKELDRSRDKAKDNDNRSPGLQVNRSIISGPRGVAPTSKASPSTTRPAGLPAPADAAGSATNGSTLSESGAPSPVRTEPPAKIRDPRYKAAYETISNFGEAVMKRSAFYHQRTKKKREMEKRDIDAKQYAGRADDFPSMVEARNKIRERDLREYANMKEEMKKYDEAFYQQADHLTMAFLNSREHQASATSTAIPDMSSLESRFDLFQKELDQAKARICELETGQQHADIKIKNLEQERQDSNSRIKELEAANKDTNQVILTVQSKCASLEEKYLQFESNVTQLKAGFDQRETWNETMTREIQSVESKIVSLETSKVSADLLTSATKELRDTQDHVSGELKRLLNDSVRKREHQQVFASTLNTLQEQVFKIGVDLLTTKNDLDQLETGKLDEIIGAWYTLHVGDKTLLHGKQISILLKEVGLSNVPDAVETNATTLREVVQQNTATIATLSQRQKVLNTNVQTTTREWGDLVGGMIDDVTKRVHNLEQLLANHGASRTPAATPKLDICASPAVGGARLEARVKAIEDQRFLERLQFGLNKAESSLKESVERMNANTVAYDAGLQDIKHSLHEIATAHEENKSRLEAQQFAIDNLNTQLNNIFTKQLAEAIVKQMDTFSSRLNPRMDLVEANVKTLGNSLKQVEENISFIKRGATAFNTNHQKRSASPSTRSNLEDIGKKRKIDVNGRVSPRPAQPLTFGNGASH